MGWQVEGVIQLAYMDEEECMWNILQLEFACAWDLHFMRSNKRERDHFQLNELFTWAPKFCEDNGYEHDLDLLIVLH